MMSLRRFSTAALAVFLACSLVSIPAMANPGNGNGNGGGQGNSGNHGNAGSHGDNGNHSSNNQHKSAKQKDGNDVSVNVS